MTYLKLMTAKSVGSIINVTMMDLHKIKFVIYN
jgi:hypothetical protein